MEQAPSVGDPAPARADIDFDENGFAAWLSSALPAVGEVVRIERIGGGQSNPTYFIDTPTRRMVLRKQPHGVLAKGAHDVGREFLILSALTGSAVPVPTPILYEEGRKAVGTPCYLMERVDGPVFLDAALPDVPRAERNTYYEALAETLAALHRVDWRATAMAELERPGRYLVRQVDRWARAWGTLATEDANVSSVVSWLRANVPPADEDVLGIVHGDYKFTNVIYTPDGPRIAGVLDWELCTIGDPLTDLAHLWSFLWQTRLDEYGGMLGADLDALGLPDFDAFAESYYRASDSPRRLTLFHRVLAHFRNAGIFHGIAQRAASGNANAGNAEQAGRLDRVFLGRALAQIYDSGTA